MNRKNWRAHLVWILALAATGCVVHTHPGPQSAPYPAAPPREVVVMAPLVVAEDPRLAQCRRDNYHEHAEAMQIYYRAQQAGNISADEAQRFAASDQRLRRYAALLGRDGLSLGECESIGRQIVEEQAMVRRMAASRPGYQPYRADPALMQCRADVQRTHAETTRLYYRAQASGEISPNEARQFSDMEQRITRHAQFVARDGLTLRECESLLRESNQDRDQVERMASNRRGTQAAPAPDRERGRPDRQATPKAAEPASASSTSVTAAAAAVVAGRAPNPTTAAVPPAPAAPVAQAAPQKSTRETNEPLARCAASNQKMRQETRQLYARALAAGAASPAQRESFEQGEQRLDKKSQELARDGLTMPECEMLARDIVEQRKLVERIAGARARAPSAQ